MPAREHGRRHQLDRLVTSCQHGPLLPLSLLTSAAIACKFLWQRTHRPRAHVQVAGPAPRREAQQDSEAVARADWGTVPDAVVDHPEPLQQTLLFAGFKCTPDELLQHIFHPGSNFLQEWAAASELAGLRPDSWTKCGRGGDGRRPWQRTVYYEMPVQSSFGPPRAFTTETQRITARSPTAWAASVTAATPNVPFGQRFHTEVCFRAWQTADGSTALHVSGQVVFTGSPGMLRGTIERATVKGLRSTYRVVGNVLAQALPTADAATLADGPPTPANATAHVQPAAARTAKQGVTEQSACASRPTVLLFMLLLGLHLVFMLCVVYAALLPAPERSALKLQLLSRCSGMYASAREVLEDWAQACLRLLPISPSDCPDAGGMCLPG